MSGIFCRHTISCEQIVEELKEALLVFLKERPLHERPLLDRLAEMKVLLYGDGKTFEADENKAATLASIAIREDLMLILVKHIEVLPFEGRKDTAHIYNNLIRSNLSGFAAYVNAHFDMLESLVSGCGNADSALSCGAMLREAIRYDELADKLLNSSLLWLFFDNYVHLKNFEVASDSFNTLRDLLTTPRNKAVASNFLHAHYDEVVTHYERLLKSENFVTRWRSLKLLGDLLLDRANFAIMIKYISSKDNLKIVMNLLRDKSPNIQYEAFHVFKVFVAYPNKPVDIALILYRNKEKLISFLDAFHTDKEDAQFIEEKCLLIETLSALKKPVAPISNSNADNLNLINSNASRSNATNNDLINESKDVIESNTLPKIEVLSLNNNNNKDKEEDTRKTELVEQSKNKNTENKEVSVDYVI